MRDINIKILGLRIMIFIIGLWIEGREIMSKNKGIFDYGELFNERSNFGNKM